ncbi:hypothetical protein LT493_13125 [Streptomyces tricolor]|nr:hypothetical protein [Streptomyces tricolor]
MPHDAKDYESRYLPDQTGFVWDFSGGRLVITGLCPACAGETRHPVPTRLTPGAVTKGGGAGAFEEDDEVPREVYMRCRCRLPHPGGHPGDRRLRCQVGGDPADGGRLVTGRYLPEELERAQQRLDAMAEAQLEIGRAQAEGWRNFLTVASGLLAAVLVLKGRENVAELPGGYRTAVVVLVAAGLVLLLVAAFVAVSAAHGRPGDVLKYPHAAKLLDWEERERERIASRIGVTRWATVAGVLAAAAGILLTWVAPGPDEPAQTVRVHTRAETLCGELLAADGSGVTVKVRPASGKGQATIRHLTWQRDAVSVAPTARC